MDIITTHTTADRKEINEFVNQVCVLAEQKFQTGMRIAKVNIHGDIVIRGATTSERALWLAQLLAQFAKKHGKQVQFSISDILVDENGYVTDSEGYAVDALKPQKQQQQQLQVVAPKLPVVYDKSAIMKRSWELRHMGMTASNAMKQAWAEYKNGVKF
jgi:hypothetical protein